MTTKRRVFYSFHYRQDAWRAAEIRNMGVLEGNEFASPNDWEEVKRGGREAIKRWIDRQMKGRSCAVVLIGAETAGRKWINYEIKKAWTDKKGLLGIYIHNLKNKEKEQSAKGRNPFADPRIEIPSLSDIIKVYNPPSNISTDVYRYIYDNIANWIEEAIRIREDNR